MPTLELSEQNGLFYEYCAPQGGQGFTFCFFNALTGDVSNWEAVIAPRLRESGHGTLAFNYRGQAKSPFSPGLVLDDTCIIDDSIALLSHAKPINPILVGLSIGGLFAARVWLKAKIGEALVLINTLRHNGPRLKWIGDALVRAVEIGGLDLFRDLFMPLLVNEDWLAQNREGFLKPDGQYLPLDPQSGYFKLLAEAGRVSDWEVPYADLRLPTLVITGLQDHVFLEHPVVDDLFNQLPNASRIDLADAGHLIPAEHPEQLAELLDRYAKER